MGKKSKKAKAHKLPKTIAGVKVPKELRDAGGMIAKLARDPAAREVALAALTAALAARKDTRKLAQGAVAETGERVRKTGKAVSWMGPALTAAAVEAGRLMLDAYDKGGKRPNSNSDFRESEDEQTSLTAKTPEGATH